MWSHVKMMYVVEYAYQIQPPLTAAVRSEKFYIGILSINPKLKKNDFSFFFDFSVFFPFFFFNFFLFCFYFRGVVPAANGCGVYQTAPKSLLNRLQFLWEGWAATHTICFDFSHTHQSSHVKKPLCLCISKSTMTRKHVQMTV